METQERLSRSVTDKVIGGVCGGLGEYFGIDVVLTRIVFVLLALFGGGGVLIYIILWIVMPAGPILIPKNNETGPDFEGNTINQDFTTPTTPAKSSNTGLIAGIILILLGVLFLGDKLMPWYNITDLWPLLLVVVGVLIIKPDIFKSTKKQSDEI